MQIVLTPINVLDTVTVSEPEENFILLLTPVLQGGKGDAGIQGVKGDKGEPGESNVVAADDILDAIASLDNAINAN